MSDEGIFQTTERDGMGTIVAQGPRPTEPVQRQIQPDVSKSFTSIVQIAQDVLINPDVAYRADRSLQEQMMHDPMVIAPLQKRMLATAQLPWEIVPPDPEDPRQKDVCANLTRIIKSIPRDQEMHRSLLLGTFRGTGASEIDWGFNPYSEMWEVVNHRPYHGDKITYDVWGNPRILTREFQTGGRQLDASEKDRLLIHTFDREDGEFYDGAQAGYVFKGRGLRDTIWPYWFLKVNCIRFWVVLLERYGTGWVEGRYPMNNLQAKNAIESVLMNLVNDSKYSLPMVAGVNGGTEENYGIFVKKMEGLSESSKMFNDFVEGWAGRHIRVTIKGEEQEMQQSGDGLGSGRAEALSDTFRMYRDYDAKLLGDTYTDQLLSKLVFYNYGTLPFKPLFRFITEKADYDQQSKRVGAAKNAGLRVPRRWVFETLDIPELTGEEQPQDIIDFGAQANPGSANGLTGDPGADLFMDGADLDGHQPNRMAAMFREALGGRERYDEDEGRWITLGGGDENGGGTHVQVNDGKIVKGPKSLKGKSLGKIGGNNKAKKSDWKPTSAGHFPSHILERYPTIASPFSHPNTKEEFVIESNKRQKERRAAEIDKHQHIIDAKGNDYPEGVVSIHETPESRVENAKANLAHWKAQPESQSEDHLNLGWDLVSGENTHVRPAMKWRGKNQGESGVQAPVSYDPDHDYVISHRDGRHIVSFNGNGGHSHAGESLTDDGAKKIAERHAQGWSPQAIRGEQEADGTAESPARDSKVWIQSAKTGRQHQYTVLVPRNGGKILARNESTNIQRTLEPGEWRTNPGDF